MGKLINPLLITSVGIAFILVTEVAAQPKPPVDQEATTVQAYDGRTMPATLIRIRIPENRKSPGRSITLTALRIPTTAGRPGRPIVFLMGGPGIPGTAMAPIPPYFTLFQRLRELGDVIIIDQRGIGHSEPVIDCPFSDSLPANFFLERTRIVSAIRSQIESCARHFQSKGVDLTAYNTIESAADLEDLRRSLGVDQIDLLAFSYGTRLALMYIDRYGEHVGRVALQGINGPGLVLKNPAPVIRKLDLIGDLLKQDSSWQGPTDLLVSAKGARERLSRQPATVTITDRKTMQQRVLQVGRDGFDAIVGLRLDDWRLPALLVSVAKNDDRVLTRFVDEVWNGLGRGNVGLMARAVNCAADRPASRWEMVRQESGTASFGMPIDNEFLTDEFCRVIGYDISPVEFARRLSSTLPVLLLTGTLDATNPVENAVEIARGFENAVLLDVENAAHESLPVPAVQDVIVDFFQGADVAGRRIATEPPHFATIEEALAPPPQRQR